jgi:hypothetical protein
MQQLGMQKGPMRRILTGSGRDFSKCYEVQSWHLLLMSLSQNAVFTQAICPKFPEVRDNLLRILTSRAHTVAYRLFNNKLIIIFLRVYYSSGVSCRVTYSA